MISCEVTVEPPWPAQDWQALAMQAVGAAMTHSAHGGLQAVAAAIEVSLRLTSDEAVRVLNRDYRHKDAATNVLSFPMVQPDLIDGLANTDDGEVLLGDIVLAHGVCAQEADDQGVALDAHATHLIVHGTLHLLGYDHMDETHAHAMEAIEQAAMAALGLHDPYPVAA